MHKIQILLAQRFPALGSRDFAIFWVGHLTSLIGTSMQNTALPLLAYRISGRPFDLGLIGFAVTLPTFFLALPGGVLIEHVDKRKAIIFLQSIMMLDTFALAILALSGFIQIWHIVITSLILGIATAFEITARQAMLIELVGRESLPNAIALQSTAFNMSRVLGPALAAPALLLFSTNGEGWIFLLNGISFVAIITSLFFVQTRYKSPVLPRTRPMLVELQEGTQYLFKNSSVGLLVVIAAILGVFAFPIIQQLPVISKDLLKQASDTKAIVDIRNSLLYTAQGVGALTAAFSIAMNNTSRWRGLRLLLGEAAFILGMIVIPISNSVWIAMIIIALMGWGAVTQLATMNTLLQLQVPDILRGRVFSIYLWALQGIAPFGSLLVGWMTQEFGLTNTTLLCGLISLGIIGGIQVFRPDIRGTTG
ncbi:MFS transporter [Candidatus Villigracilis affinis]|uniref:MFS transporter n=1 Tax=Candidatus Villigracilis affinis TaxID=3140682 RepID=UPI001D5B1E84|nr:MFS transporter [Anaerolineales bacterium]